MPDNTAFPVTSMDPTDNITGGPTDGSGGPQCMAIMYHYVHDRFSGFEAIPHEGRGVRGLTIAEFEAQLDLLTAQLEPLDWTALWTGLRGKKDLPSRSFLLTFDDGLREHAEIVLPILERRGLKGVFFVPGSVLSKPRMLSAHLVHLLLEALGEDKLIADIRNTLASSSTNPDLTQTDDALALKIYHYESPQLARLKFLLTMKLPLPTRTSVISRLFERHIGPQQEWTARWYLQADQVRELHALGHTVGGHSFGHEPYGRLDAAALERDIGRSAFAIQDILGSGQRPFAYPFGSVHPKASSFLNAAGFVRAFGTTPTWIVPESPSMNLPRVDTIRVEAELQEALT